jgi:Zn-finger nucleic acid-binding protein
VRCPRDKNPLHWKDFLLCGRWYCRKCTGTFVYRVHLQKNSALYDFFESFVEVASTDQLQCPKCDARMSTLASVDEGVDVQIDRCDECEGYWFDPGELKAIRAPQSERSGTDLVGTTPHSQIRIYSAYEIYEKKRADQHSGIFRALCIFAILVNIFIYYKTAPFGDQYVGALHRRRAPPPHVSAVSAIVLLIPCFAFTIRVWWLLIPIACFMFAALMIWLTRL